MQIIMSHIIPLVSTEDRWCVDEKHFFIPFLSHYLWVTYSLPSLTIMDDDDDDDDVWIWKTLFHCIHVTYIITVAS